MRPALSSARTQIVRTTPSSVYGQYGGWQGMEMELEWLTGRVGGRAELWKFEALSDGASRGCQADEKDATEGPFVVDGDFDLLEVEDWPEGVEEISRNVAAWGSR